MSAHEQNLTALDAVLNKDFLRTDPTEAVRCGREEQLPRTGGSP